MIKSPPQHRPGEHGGVVLIIVCSWWASVEKVLCKAPTYRHTENTHLKGIGWGDRSEALAVESSLSQLGQAKVSVVDGEHNAGLPQAVVVIVAPEGPACRKSDRWMAVRKEACAYHGRLLLPQNRGAS